MKLRASGVLVPSSDGPRLTIIGDVSQDDFRIGGQTETVRPWRAERDIISKLLQIPYDREAAANSKFSKNL